MRKAIHFMDKFIVSIGALAIIAMMLTIVYDVIWRYVVGDASTLSYTLSECYLMTAIVFLGLAYTQKENAHTRVTLFLKFFPKTVRKIFDIIGTLLTLLIFSIIGYQGLMLTIRAFLQNEIYIGIYNWPMYLAYVILPIGALAMLFQCLLDLYDKIKLLLDKDKDSMEYNEESAL